MASKLAITSASGRGETNTWDNRVSSTRPSASAISSAVMPKVSSSDSSCVRSGSGRLGSGRSHTNGSQATAKVRGPSAAAWRRAKASDTLLAALKSTWPMPPRSAAVDEEEHQER